MLKPNFYKAEDFANGDSLALLAQDLEEIDAQKEGVLINRNLLRTHGQEVV